MVLAESTTRVAPEAGYTVIAHFEDMGEVSVTVDSRGAGKFTVKNGENSREFSRSEAIGAWIKAQSCLTRTDAAIVRRFVVFQAAADARRTTAGNR